ncbi:MAG: tRNA pseudouridine(55) synthase TruB [Synechococcales cyanobacterium]
MDELRVADPPPPVVAGWVNLDKPLGITSHDAVAILRKGYRTRQIGHGGTLDPEASGVLPLAVGQATRLLSFVEGDKGYEATFRLGQRSRTDDATGEITVEHPCPHITLELVQSVLPQFVGNIWQRPPDFSAIRQQGQRLYEKARQGEVITVDPRLVRVEQIEVLDWRPGLFPELDLAITCGPGTYIRALARDLGICLGCGGLMSALRRTASLGFALEESVTVEQWRRDPWAALWPIGYPFRQWPWVELTPEQRQRWWFGQKLALAGETARVAVRDTEGQFLGLGSREDGILKSLRVIGAV